MNCQAAVRGFDHMSAPSIMLRSLRVFVVENHEDTAKYCRLYLEAAGHQVCEARTLTAALTEIPVARCDVLISDIGLPDGTGWELLETLRQRGLPHPSYAIAMSGYGWTADQLKSTAAGFRHHVLKPFDIDKMDGLLAEAACELVG